MLPTLRISIPFNLQTIQSTMRTCSLSGLRLLAAQLLLLAAAASASPAAGSCMDAEQLLSFKATFTNGDEQMPDWAADADGACRPCSWEGVVCNDAGAVAEM